MTSTPDTPDADQPRKYLGGKWSDPVARQERARKASEAAARVNATPEPRIKWLEQHADLITYEQARRLVELGARVLNPPRRKAES